jgi:hypothetical protein
MPRISADRERRAFRIMSAIMPETGFFGLKTLTGYPGRRLAGETYFAVLFSCDTGALRAVVAGNQLTGIRTGAATGVARKYLSRENSQVLGVIVAGVQGRYQVAALLAVRPIQEIRVFDIDTAKARRSRGRSLDFQVEARMVTQVRDAVAGCDLIVTATAAKAPVFEGQWLEDGASEWDGLQHPGQAGARRRRLQQEHDRRRLQEQALQEAGDLRRRCGREPSSRPSTSSWATSSRGRNPAGDTIRDHALQVGRDGDRDIAMATFAYQKALAAGLGTARSGKCQRGGRSDRGASGGARSDHRQLRRSTAREQVADV